jgi:hypothetical protein
MLQMDEVQILRSVVRGNSSILGSRRNYWVSAERNHGMPSQGSRWQCRDCCAGDFLLCSGSVLVYGDLPDEPSSHMPDRRANLPCIPITRVRDDWGWNCVLASLVWAESRLSDFVSLPVW